MFGPLPRYLALYTVLFAAYGVASPFLPVLLAGKGLSSSGIGIVLAAGTAIRLPAGPAGGRLADRSAAPRRVLGGLLIAASVIALGYLQASGLMILLLVSMLHAAVLAPLNPVSDALTLAAASMHRFQYGWVRGAGSAAFILGTVLSGIAIGRFGLPVFVWLNAILLLAASSFALALPPRPRPAPRHGPSGGGTLSLLRLPWFVRLMLVAAFVQGSHALHDSFAVIRWQAAGISSAAAGLLWSEAVAAEILVFAGIGQMLLDRLGPGGAATLAALAGVLRWTVMAQTSWLPAMAMIEPLHGLTFALLHLACMRLMSRLVPIHLAARAQAFYGTVAVGAMTALLTLVSGPLYQVFGAAAFWPMAGLCAAAIPLAHGLPRRSDPERDG